MLGQKGLSLMASGEACPLCKSERPRSHTVFAEDCPPKTEMTVLECRDCHFAWQWPRQRSQAESLSFFEEGYRQSEEDSYFDDGTQESVSQMQLSFLERMRPQKGTLLDLGSGNGSFARLAFDRGWSVVGLDPAGPEEAESGEGACSLLLSQSSLEAFDDTAKFDVVALWDVIEHLDDPIPILRRCQERLAPGGVLILETGNFDSFDRVRAGPNWWCYQFDHRWYFSPSTLEALLTSLGFESFQIGGEVLRPWTQDRPRDIDWSIVDVALKALRRPWQLRHILSTAKQFRRLRRSKAAAVDQPIFVMTARVVGQS